LFRHYPKQKAGVRTREQKRLNNKLDYTEKAAGDEAKLYIRASKLMWLIFERKWRYVEQANNKAVR
jgi:hypothetical protein